MDIFPELISESRIEHILRFLEGHFLQLFFSFLFLWLELKNLLRKVFRESNSLRNHISELPHLNAICCHMFAWLRFHSVRYILLRETKLRAGRIPVIKCRRPVSILIQRCKATLNGLLLYRFKTTGKAKLFNSINPESLF